ncbi:ATP-dependent RNA helicase dbp6 [Lecanora helva]
MASQFYKRYIPPQLSNVEPENDSRPAKRRKKSKPDKGAPLKNTQPQSNSVEDDDISHLVRKRDKSKSEKERKGGKTLSSLNSIETNEIFGTAKKRKKSKIEKETLQKYDSPQLSNEELGDVSPPAKKRKKSKTKKETTQKNDSRSAKPAPEIKVEVNVLQSSPPDENSQARQKDQKILAKYKKAVEKSTTLQEKESTDKKAEPSKAEHVPVVNLHDLEPSPQPDSVEIDRKKAAYAALPEWLRDYIVVPSTNTRPWSKFKINEETLSTLQEKDHHTAFAIQSAILPMLLPGSQHYEGDICISAETGSGKTLAYALPMVEALRDRPQTRLEGLIVVPTRELVEQVKSTLRLCGAGTSLEIGTAVGSMSFKEEQASLIQKEQRYDPEGYRKIQQDDSSEDRELTDWIFDQPPAPVDDENLLYNHVPHYTSKVVILVCTPGRLVEHVQSTVGFTLQHVQWLVIDEADRLLDESFQQWIDVVLPGLEYMPPMTPAQERLSVMFRPLRCRHVRKVILSATMKKDVSEFTPLKLRRPRLVVLERPQSQDLGHYDVESANLDAQDRIELPSTLYESGIKVLDTNEKPLYLVEILNPGKDSEIQNDRKRRMPNGKPKEHDSDIEESGSEGANASSDSEHNSSQSSRSEVETPQKSSLHPPTARIQGTLIFTKTNEHASRLARLLSLMQPTWSSRISTLTKTSASSKARKTLSAFRKNKLSILIASDRASRGLDIPDLAHVVNYDMPPSLTSYIHRVGRTARAGKEGRATTLIAENEARWFWNEIARNAKVGRGEGRRVVRDNRKFEFGEEVRRRYEEALETVGREAQG